MKLTTNNGVDFWIDPCDHAVVKEYGSWLAYATGGARYTYYVMTRLPGRKRLYLHRLIAKAKHGEEVDHIDGNGLNNRRRNLRKCSHAENHQNHQRARRDSSTGVRGVYQDKRSKRPLYVAYYRKNGTIHRVGYFRSVKDADVAIRKARAEAFTHSQMDQS